VSWIKYSQHHDDLQIPTTCQEVMGAGGSMGDIGKKISEEWNALGNSFARSGYSEFPKHIEIILNASEL